MPRETQEPQPGTSLYGQDILSISQFNRTSLKELFQTASEMKLRREKRDPSLAKVLQGQRITLAFFEPSTRTKMSFDAAIQLLGGDTLDAAPNSSFQGESFKRTIATCAEVSDGIVLRHSKIEALEQALAVSQVPIINAGNGTGEHPTQALLDLYAIDKLRGTIDGVKIGIMGDIKHGRTVHSLLRGLSSFNGVTCFLASPDALSLTPEEIKEYEKLGVKIIQVKSPQEIPDHALDVVYVTRLQKERLGTVLTPGLIEELQENFTMSSVLLDRVGKKSTILMHPLPRNDEIPESMDDDPRSVYFHQAQNGLYIRMALLQSVFAR